MSNEREMVLFELAAVCCRLYLMANKVLVTGINGFVGKHLARALADSGYSVCGITRESVVDNEIVSLVKEHQGCDLTDKEQVNRIDFSPYKAIINLAGLANVGQSFNNSDLYMKVNVSVLTNICQRLLDQRLETRILAISTGGVYYPHQQMPLTEVSRLTPSGSPYVKSKIAMENEAKSFQQRGVNCIIARPFNHIGPGQTPGFLVPDLIVKARQSLQENSPMMVGNLKTRRDYTDVRDVVKAYVALAVEDLDYETYNICSGYSVSGEEMLSLITKELAADQKIKIETNPNLIRPDDPAEIYGSFERLQASVGWKPKIPIEQTIADAVASSI